MVVSKMGHMVIKYLKYLNIKNIKYLKSHKAKGAYELLKAHLISRAYYLKKKTYLFSLQVKVLQERVSEAQRYARTEMKDQEQRRKQGRKRGPGGGGDGDDEVDTMTKKKIFSKSSKKKRR